MMLLYNYSDADHLLAFSKYYQYLCKLYSLNLDPKFTYMPCETCIKGAFSNTTRRNSCG